MFVKNHRLFKGETSAVEFVRSPNYQGDIQRLEYLVIHFTAGISAASSISWLTDPRAKASAHLVIGRDGSITQLVPFNKRAWHAGNSAWASRIGLNSYSIGIELDNAGKLHRVGQQWQTWSGQHISDDEVVIARHKHESTESGWHAYTQEQLTAALEVATVLVEKYNLLDVVGHEDIAPGRKTDPGPAFPLESFRAHVLGRSEDAEMRYQTTTVLNIRSGPGAEFAPIPGSPLPAGTEVVVQKTQGNWRFVDVLNVVNENADLEGWVHGRYLAAV